MEKLYQILSDCRPDVDFRTETGLVDRHVLESLDIVMLVGELADAFQVRIGVDDLTPENFNSAEAIYAMLCRLREA